MTKEFRTKYLTCGCCGLDFNTWPEYQDQDQDKGFGICEECQNRAEVRENDFINDTVKKILPSLKPENQKKLKEMSIEQKRYVIDKLMEKGSLQWKIGGAN